MGSALVFTLLLGGSVYSYRVVTAPPSPASLGAGPAPEAFLPMALTAANAYYELHNTFEGVDRSVKNATGLRVLSGELASGHAHEVSLYVPPKDGGQALVLVAWAAGVKACFGVVEVKNQLPARRSVMGEARTGSYFFVSKNPSTCAAATAQPAAIQRNTWPNPSYWYS